jgi:hypothetical protein
MTDEALCFVNQGRALAWGARGRQFKSARPDQLIFPRLTSNSLQAANHRRVLNGVQEKSGYKTADEALAAPPKEMENITLSLIPAETDPPLRSPEYQQELEKVASTLGAEGMKVSYVVELEESAGSETVLLGKFTIELAKTVGPALGAVGVAVAAWLPAIWPKGTSENWRPRGRGTNR